MRKDCEQTGLANDGPRFVVELTFKPDWQSGKLSDAEKQLLLAYSGEILAEIEIEEKRIIAEERRAALEVTARKPQQEG
jgi:hypothetical protein